MAHPIPARSTKIAPEKRARDVPLLLRGLPQLSQGHQGLWASPEESSRWGRSGKVTLLETGAGCGAHLQHASL